MRVCLDARAAAGDLTGVGQYIVHLAEELIKNGHKVTLLYQREPKQRVDGTETIILPEENRLKWEQNRLAKFLKTRAFDVYHATWNYGIPLNYRGRSVLTVHDVIPLKWPRYFCGRNILTLPEYLFSLTTSVIKARRIIADSFSSANDLASIYPLTRKKTAVIPLGLSPPPDLSDADVKDALAKFGLVKPFLIYFGGVDKRKNIDGLIHAYARNKAKEKVKLVIVGRHADYYQSLAVKLSLADKVRFLDYVSEREKFLLLKNAAVLVYPSFYEGFGLPPLEAMAVGTPVITSAVSSLPENTGGAALLVNPHKIDDIAVAIDRIVSDASLRQDLISKGLEQVKKFSWQKMAEATLKVYEGAMAAN